MPALTTYQLRALGSAAADRGESIYEAEIRSGLTSAELLEFEAGYFERRFAREQVGGQGLVCADPSGDFEIRVLHDAHFSAN